MTIRAPTKLKSTQVFLSDILNPTLTVEWVPMFYYFVSLGLHLLLIGISLHMRMGLSGALLVKIWSTSLAKWVVENPKRGKLLMGTLLLCKGIAFASLEINFLVSFLHQP